MNINDLKHDPNPLESTNVATRYEIETEDQEHFGLAETAWFDDETGDLVDDIDE